MTDTSTVMKVLGGFGVLAAVIGPTFLVSQYVTDLQRDVSISKSEVERLKGQVDQLQDLLEKTQAAFSSSTRASKGDKGDKGDTGERGEQGPRGERGPAGLESDSSTLQAMVRSVVAAEMKSLGSQVASNGGSNFVDTSGGFDLSKCVPASEIRKAEAITVKVGMEICETDGSLLATVTEIREPKIHFFSPGYGKWNISGGGKRSFDWDAKREFYAERFGDGSGKDATATIRFQDK